MNEAVLTLFRGSNKLSDQELIRLLRYFQIPVPGGTVLDRRGLRKADFFHLANQKLTQKLYQVLSIENGNAKPEATLRAFRFHVGSGNNATVVREVISRRSWWTRSLLDLDKFDYKDCHFIWTQWQRDSHYQFLKRADLER